jgi:hypothetical protein
MNFRPHRPSVSSLITKTLFIPLFTVACFTQAQNIITFDVPSSNSTQPAAINGAGVITGSYSDSNGHHGFVRDVSGTITPFDAPSEIIVPRTDTTATAINDVGQITGFVFPITYMQSGYLRQPDGTFVTFGSDCFGPTISQHVVNALLPILPGLGFVEGTAPTAIDDRGEITGACGPGAEITLGFSRQVNSGIIVFEPKSVPDPSTRPLAINSRGEITGVYLERQPVTLYRGFFREADGTMTTFDAPSSGSTPQSTIATAINSRGQVTGYTDQGFLRQPDGKMNTFAVPNSISTQPASINAKGEIAGAYVDANGLYHGFLRDKHGTLSTFDVPNALNTYPVSINAKGDITGWYSDAAGTHGFICNRFDFDDDL